MSRKGAVMDEQPDALSEFARAAFAWLDTPAATRLANRLIHRYRLFLEPDDVLNEARLRVWRRTATEHADLVNAPAYCSTVIANIVKKIERGAEPRDVDEELVWQPGPGAVVPQESDSAEFLDDLRAGVETSGEQPWVVSGALTAITLTLYDTCDLRGVPQPAGRAQQARMWAGLWFSGKRDGFFANQQADHPRIRQARARACSRIADLLDRVTLTMRGQR